MFFSGKEIAKFQKRKRKRFHHISTWVLEGDNFCISFLTSL